MKSIRRAGALLMALCVLFLSTVPASGEDSFTARVKEAFRKRQVISGCVLISLNGETVYSYSQGMKDIRGGTWTTGTVTRVASVTKFVTAIGLMTLWEKQAFDLDYSIQPFLPFPVYNPFYPETPITFRQILSHTSSFKEGVNYMTPEWEKISVKRNNYYDENVRPGEGFAYSNMNGGMFGGLIEALSGQGVHSYMKENVFEPLGIDAAYHPGLLKDPSVVGDMFAPAGNVFISGRAQLNRLYEYDDTSKPREHLGTTVGQLYISAEDLLVVLNTLLNDGVAPNGTVLLQPETVRLMEADQSTIPLSSVHVTGDYGLGMQRVSELPGPMWFGHQGRVSGYSCDAFYQPDTGLAIVVIGNGYTVQRRGTIVVLARDLMEMAGEFVK